MEFIASFSKLITKLFNSTEGECDGRRRYIEAETDR